MGSNQTRTPAPPNMLLKILVLIVLLVALGLSALRLQRAADERKVKRIWQSLETQPVKEVFTADMVADLPEPARRYFLHTIQPGTPLASSALLEMKGTFRTKPGSAWMPMTAEQLVVPSRGFVWRARIGNGLLWLQGADFYFNGHGGMNFWLWGLFPVARSKGPDISRSALGRLATEALLVPSSLLPQRGAKWEAVDDQSAKVIREIDGERFELTLRLDAVGRVRSVVMPRWGNFTEAGNFTFIPFGGDLQAERTFAGYTIPTQLSVGWWYGDTRYFEFFRAAIDSARYR